MKYVLQFLEFIRIRGLTRDQSLDHTIIGLLNLFSFFTALGGLGVFIAAALTDQHPAFQAVCFSIFVLYGFVVLLSHWGRPQWLRFAYAFLLPVWFSTAILLVGAHFEAGLAASTSTFISYIIYRKEVRIRNLSVVYNLAMYAVPLLYTSINQPIFGHQDFPGDELVVVLLSVLWLSVIFAHHNQQTQKIIQTKDQEIKARTEELEQFVYIGSHDLKAPVRNIMGLLDLANAHLRNGETEELVEA